jgi:hypothetical protein
MILVVLITTMSIVDNLFNFFNLEGFLSSKIQPLADWDQGLLVAVSCAKRGNVEKSCLPKVYLLIP